MLNKDGSPRDDVNASRIADRSGDAVGRRQVSRHFGRSPRRLVSQASHLTTRASGDTDNQLRRGRQVDGQQHGNESVATAPWPDIPVRNARPTRAIAGARSLSS